MTKLYRIIIALLPSLSIYSTADATVTEFTNKQLWQAGAGPFTTIPFTGFPDGTLITTQYSHLGITFTDGLDQIYLNNNIFLNDGAGLYGALDTISVSFSQPMTSIAVDYPGFVRIKLYDQGRLIYTSTTFPAGGAGHFGGLISTQPFDSALLLGPLGTINIDDLHFGPPIPAPPGIALALLGAAVIGKSRRRRIA